MEFIDKGSDEEEYEEFHKIVLDSLANNTAQTIQVGSIGSIDADDKHSHGYYMVGFSSSTYTLQEDKTVDEKVMNL